MQESKKIQITLRANVIEYLERFSVEKGLSKSAVITLALDRLQQSEKGVADENGKKK
jgi:hypothetical protein